MRIILCAPLIVVLGSLVPWPSHAADFTLDIPKGQVLIVKIPRSLWTREKLNASSGQSIYTVEIDSKFMGGRKWEEGAVPYLREFYMEKTEDCGRMRYDCKMKGYRQVELRNPTVWLKLRFAPDVTDAGVAFHDLVARGTVADFEASEFFKNKIFAAQAAAIFTGPLAGLPQTTQQQLFLVSLHNGAEKLSSQSYKDKAYLVAALGEGDDVYNSLRLNQSARVAKLVNEQLLDLLKKFGSTLPVGGDLYGLKLERRIAFKDFTRESDPYSYDQLHIYAPSESIKKFSDADITSQQFMDACVVLLNGNRIQVNLSGS